jgi:hypothetical protein
LLDDEEVHRIEVEEHLRFAIRQDLEARGRDRRFRASVWRFLNSAFGLFVCSSVVLAGIARLHAYYQQQEEQRAANQAEIALYASELDYRVRQIEFWRTQLVPDPSDKPEINIWRIVVGDELFTPTHPQFRHFHARGILNRLGVLTRERPAEAIEAISRLENLGRWTNWEYDVRRLDPPLSQLRTYRDLMLKHVQR